MRVHRPGPWANAAGGLAQGLGTLFQGLAARRQDEERRKLRELDQQFREREFKQRETQNTWQREQAAQAQRDRAADLAQTRRNQQLQLGFQAIEGRDNTSPVFYGRLSRLAGGQELEGGLFDPAPSDGRSLPGGFGLLAEKARTDPSTLLGVPKAVGGHQRALELQRLQNERIQEQDRLRQQGRLEIERLKTDAAAGKADAVNQLRAAGIYLQNNGDPGFLQEFIRTLVPEPAAGPSTSPARPELPGANFDLSPAPIQARPELRRMFPGGTKAESQAELNQRRGGLIGAQERLADVRADDLEATRAPRIRGMEAGARARNASAGYAEARTRTETDLREGRVTLQQVRIDAEKARTNALDRRLTLSERIQGFHEWKAQNDALLDRWEAEQKLSPADQQRFLTLRGRIDELSRRIGRMQEKGGDPGLVDALGKNLQDLVDQQDRITSGKAGGSQPETAPPPSQPAPALPAPPRRSGSVPLLPPVGPAAAGQAAPSGQSNRERYIQRLIGHGYTRANAEKKANAHGLQ